MNLTNKTLVDLNIAGGTKEHSGDVIKVASALKETPTTNDLTASVESSFKKFLDDMTVGTSGP